MQFLWRMASIEKGNMRIDYEQVGRGMYLTCDNCDLVIAFGDSAASDQKMHEFKKQHEAECVVYKIDDGRCP